MMFSKDTAIKALCLINRKEFDIKKKSDTDVVKTSLTNHLGTLEECMLEITVQMMLPQLQYINYVVEKLN